MKRKFQILIKIAAIGFTALILLIPLIMIRSLISERQDYRSQAMAEAAQSWADEQTIIGPILVIPYNKQTTVKKWDPEERVHTYHKSSKQYYLYLSPETLDVEASVDSEERYKGIYTFPVYSSSTEVSGNFKIEGMEALSNQKNISFEQPPYLIVGISDPRGIREVPKIEWDGSQQSFNPGCPNNILPSGIHLTLKPFSREQEGKLIAYQFTLQLQGMGAFKVTPIGKNVSIGYHSDWPHPSFVGPYNNSEHSISGHGFEAFWKISHFATNISQTFGKRSSQSFQHLASEAVGVRFVNPVDVYLISERSVKYGFLFIALTFVAFFLFEILKDLRVHPIQYGLVGIALALFFLLLLSLSEHISFAYSYLIAAGACVSLLSFYVTYVLKHSIRGIGFAAILSAVYGTLYTLLQLEDFALLMGALLLFSILAIVMIVTRNVDWYRIAGQENETKPPTLPPTLAKGTL
ncbi:MAG: cell envelope integrity protein CreD [Verrucomicrobiota bacterium]